MRLIDADALKDKCYITVNGTTIGRTNYVMFNEIDDAPTIDAVEVVRCGECKHYSVEGETTHFGWCGYWNKPTDEMRFCSDGERREP